MKYYGFLSLLFYSLCTTAQSLAISPAGIGLLGERGFSLQLNSEKYFSLRVEPGAYDSARDLIRTNEDLFGLPAGTRIELSSVQRAANGTAFVRARQLHEGIPVFGASMSFQLDTNGKPTKLAGYLVPKSAFIPAIAPAAAPISPQALARAAKLALTNKYPHAADWNAVTRQRSWMTTNPWQGKGAYALTQVFEVSEPGGYQMERVFVSLETGKVIFNHQLHCELNRELYHANTAQSNLIWREGDVFPGSLDAEDQEMLRGTEDTYNLFNRTFGRLGYDGQDGLMRQISRSTRNCPNASASGNTIRHCVDVVSDDIVGHEWTHNYIESMNGLIYSFESGAINEAYADIFGEVIDLLNDRGNDTDDDVFRSSCNDVSQRWIMGEDAVAFPGGLRDMWFPECKGDPSSRGSDRYACLDADEDNGGVHINSGVVNTAFSLMVDGGTLNGFSVNAIGMTKSLHIFHHANANYITPVTDIHQLANMLLQSTQDLYGTNLLELTVADVMPPLSGEIITAADSLQVVEALLATGMLDVNPCATTPTLAQDPPEQCGAGPGAFSGVLLAQNWETGIGGWTLDQAPVNPATWTDQPWRIVTGLPEDRPGLGAFAANQRIGNCNDDLENGETMITSPTVSIPDNAELIELRFTHYYSIEPNFDGGIVEMSIGEGPFQQIGEEAFLYNGYDGPLRTNNDNPRAGQPAFHGSDEGRLTGTWGTSVVDLAAAGARPGDDIKIRWNLTSDGCNGWLGWYLDEINVFACGSTEILPVEWVSIAATPAKETIYVSWKTAREVDNAFFSIERSTGDRGIFTELATLAANGQGSGTYTYTDQQVTLATDYTYRIKQTDVDGRTSYSPLASATLIAAATTLRAFPNPANDFLEIRSAGNQLVYLTTITGQTVRTTKARDGRARIDLTGISSGIYILRSGTSAIRVVVAAE